MIDYEQIKQLKALRREAEGLKYSIDHAKPEIVRTIGVVEEFQNRS